MRSGLGRRNADRSGERAVGKDDALGEPHVPRSGVDLRDAQPRVRILLGEEAEARDDRRPAPSVRRELEQLDGEDVSRAGALDEHRSADRVDVREVELGDVLHSGAGVNLLVRGIADVQPHDRVRLHFERGLDRVVPDVAERLAAQIVDGSTVQVRHLGSSRENTVTEGTQEPERSERWSSD